MDDDGVRSRIVTGLRELADDLAKGETLNFHSDEGMGDLRKLASLLCGLVAVRYGHCPCAEPYFVSQVALHAANCAELSDADIMAAVLRGLDWAAEEAEKAERTAKPKAA
jgi:hypothetical protein